MEYATDTAEKVARDANPEARQWIRELAKERDALAAHVAATTVLMNRFFLCDDYSANGDGDGTSDGLLVPAGLVEEFADLSATAPASSLARLKTEWQAEALEEAASMADKVEDD